MTNNGQASASKQCHHMLSSAQAVQQCQPASAASSRTPLVLATVISFCKEHEVTEPACSNTSPDQAAPPPLASRTTAAPPQGSDSASHSQPQPQALACRWMLNPFKSPSLPPSTIYAAPWSPTPAACCNNAVVIHTHSTPVPRPLPTLTMPQFTRP